MGRQWHLGGGAGGIKHFMDNLMDPMTGMFKVLGNPQITPDLKQTITEGILQEAGNRSVEQLAKDENELLVGLLHLRAQHGWGQSEAKTSRMPCNPAANTIRRRQRPISDRETQGALLLGQVLPST
jgi:ribosomal protein L29